MTANVLENVIQVVAFTGRILHVGCWFFHGGDISLNTTFVVTYKR